MTRRLQRITQNLVLSEFVPHVLDDGTRVLVHPWMAEHYAKQAKNYQQKCDATAKSGLARKALSEAAHCDRPQQRTLTESEPESESARRTAGIAPACAATSTSYS
jgi:hypothetical protein